MPNPSSKTPVISTIALGGILLGFAGAVVGFYLGGPGAILIGTLCGALLGGCVGRMGARIFLASVASGAVGLGLLGYLAGGWDVMDICAGTGSAIGGFVGIVIENLLKSRKKRDEDRIVDPRFCR